MRREARGTSSCATGSAVCFAAAHHTACVLPSFWSGHTSVGLQRPALVQMWETLRRAKSLCEGTSPRYPSFLESYQPFSSGQGLSTQMSLSPSNSPASKLGGPAVPTAQEGVFPVCCRKLILHQPRIADWHAWVEGLEGKAVLHREAGGLVLAS